MRTGNEHVASGFQRRYGLFATDRREVIEKDVEAVAGRQVVDQVLTGENVTASISRK
jgi:hypothetical protein